MRRNRLLFILLAFYFVFLGGGVYYTLFFPLRYFHHALVTVLLAGWLVRRARRGQGLPHTPLNPAIYALVVVWFITAFTALDARMALENVWFMLVHVLLFFVLVDMMQQGRQRLVMEAQFILTALVVLLSLLEIASWYFGLGVLPGTQTGWIDVIGPGAWLPLQPVRLSLAMSISTLLAGYAAPLVVVCAAWALTVRGRDFCVVLWILAALMLGVTLLTFSRGGIVSLAVSLGVFVALRVIARLRAETRTRREMIAGIGLLVVMGVAATAVILLISQNPGRITGDARRLDLWRSAVDMVRDYPVFGVGTGMYGRALRTYRDPALADDGLAAAHNLYLNTAAEIGLVGLAVCVVLAVITLRVWWQGWHRAPGDGARLRHEAVCAALLGVAAHSVFDTFTVTAVVSVFLVLIAYSVAGQMRRDDAPAAAGRWTGLAALALVLAYGVWFVFIDRAHLSFQRSLRGDENRLEAAQAAAEADPALNLYALQVEYIISEGGDPDAAQAAYLRAVALEPTWDTGWLNLAALAEDTGDIAQAISYLDTARRINYHNPGALHWARLNEAAGTASDADIVAAYQQAIEYQIIMIRGERRLPLSDFWGETSLRREALARTMADLPPDWQYRIAAVHFPDMLAEIVPETPLTAPEWWAAGEYALAVLDDAETAAAHFSEAISHDRANGDYYVSRARARLVFDEDGARRDLALAGLLGTLYEYPNAVRAALADTEEERYELRVRALSPRVIAPYFEGVVFRRAASFDLLPGVRFPGPGRAAMQPWYDIAGAYEAAGDDRAALNAYRAILDYAPYETQARQALARLAG